MLNYDDGDDDDNGDNDDNDDDLRPCTYLTFSELDIQAVYCLSIPL